MHIVYLVTQGIKLYHVRDWSLITGRGGGLQNGRGAGASEVLALHKCGGGGGGVRKKV